MQNASMLEMIYLAKDGVISKRKIHILHVNEDTFQAYCHLRKCRRTFKVDNVLALAPIFRYESLVI
ncbi:hypothetical protein BI350_09040 [Sporosarcina ureilytica]|uniref:Transcriptional regulator n=2 Tax=Sporosarcina ureilytica TaxID=298596 RepID=A0A1D8JKG1_9BACL|nr:hypothetical protein BI350_09040 [Sporosarcina ureilytica]